MNHRILVNPDTEQAWEISLRPGINRIGSAAENDFIIDHPSISPAHCELWVSEAGVILKDLGSTQGTFVDGSVAHEVPLRDGQHIQFGAIDSLFESLEPDSGTSLINQPAAGATIVVAGFGPPPSASPDAIQPPTAEVEPSLTTAGPDPMTALPTTDRPKRFPVHVAHERQAASQKRFLHGVAGAAAGGFIGAAVWYLLIKSTGSTFALVAWGVGVLTGLGARLLAREGSLNLGVAAGLCALLAIVFGEYLAVKAIVAREGTKLAAFAYSAQMEHARQAVKAETPDDFRKLIAGAEEKNPADISDEQIRTFQEAELPGLREFAQGRPSREEFARQMGEAFAEEFNYREFFFKDDVKSGLFMVLFAVLGIATAYKIGSGESDDN